MGGSSPEYTVIDRVDPLVGVTIDRRYRLDTRLAQGGFGAIYRGYDLQANKPIALKVLHQRLVSDEGAVARFRREGATLTALKSPYTIAAYAIGESREHGLLYITMELLHGVSLFERFRARGPISWRTMAKITRQVCHSLAEAHELGIIHRDLKPTNIHLEDLDGDKDHVKVLDFGIAKILQAGQTQTIESADLTNAGQMIGTLDYMSPEQMVGGTLTGQTDIYTLGIVTYEMVAGRRPFAEAPTVAGVLAAMLRTRPLPLTRIAGVPAEMDRIVQRCLAQKVEERYRDVITLGADLDALLAAQPDDADATRQLVVDVRDSGMSEQTAINAPRPGFDIPGPSAESTVVSMPPSPLSTLPGVTPPDAIRERLSRVSQMPPFGAPQSDDEPTVAMGSRNPMLLPMPQPRTPSPPLASPVTPPRDEGNVIVPVPRAPAPPAPPPMMAIPPTPYPYARPPQDLAARLRDAMAQRTVWVAVLVCAAVLGIGVAARCS